MFLLGSGTLAWPDIFHFWSGLVFMVFWVGLVCCSCDGLHWSGWGDNIGLEWSGVFMVMCSGPGLWFWASSTHYHLRCSRQLHLRLCLTSQMKVSFYEARDVPAVWLCFHPHSLLNVSRQNYHNL